MLSHSDVKCPKAAGNCRFVAAESLWRVHLVPSAGTQEGLIPISLLTCLLVSQGLRAAGCFGDVLENDPGNPLR